jgi:hypothetical protein
MLKTVTRSFTLTRSQADFLKKEAARREIMVSDLLRRIIDEYRDKKEQTVSGTGIPDGTKLRK